MKLSKIQERTLEKFGKSNEWVSAYELQESIGTLESLLDKNLIEIKHSVGDMFFPRTAIEWRLKKGEL